jgi:CelD/BcsL family acetyltransferase involved in cellulose biosynthesis
LTAYRVESFVIDHADTIKAHWLDLQERADCSYFQSWGWIGTWLEQVAIGLQPVVIKVWANDNLVGIGLFVLADIRRRFIIHSKAMFLNEYLLDGKNMVIEYNGLLSERGHEEAVNTETVMYLLKEFKGQDEFYFNAIDEAYKNYLMSKPIKGADISINDESPSWALMLDTVSEGVDGYLDSLSKNRRAQIRRCLRLYEERGSLQIEEAGSMTQAMDFFDRLKILHTARWQSSGKEGSFSNHLWEDFHRSLISSRFNAGEIQLLRAHNGHEDIGYLYNFIWRKHVYVLQTGFSISKDKRLMPGYVVHVLAVAYNKQKGMIMYDLMHGDSLYKRILCNQKRKLFWAVLRRRKLKFYIEKLATDMVRGCRRITRSELKRTGQ